MALERLLRCDNLTRQTIQTLTSIFLFVASVGPTAVNAATVPNGFTDSVVVSGLNNPTAMAFAPDGRIFVCEQGGALRVIKNGVLLTAPFLTVTVDSAGERGLLGVALDPNFASNQLVYIYYTATTPTVHNRISRFIASGDVALSGSETLILELNELSNATNHNGGAIHFGPDGNLYVAVGDNANGANSQSLSTRLGKILRLGADGSIPADNPFVNSTSGDNQAIWALGLRNPFTFSFQAGSGRMFINDVGENKWEEIDDGIAGANYGWPTCEGVCKRSNQNFRDPIFSYAHGTQNCAITGGAFYNPQSIQFPVSYVGNYFFSDFCGGWIRTLNPAINNAVTDFATGISFPVDLKVSSDGNLYYLARGSGSVNRIQVSPPDNVAPTVEITNPEDGTTVSRRADVTLTADATDGVGVSRVEFYVNGNLQCTAVTAPYSCNWKVPSPPNKTYLILARAFDLSGNSGMATVQVVSQ